MSKKKPQFQSFQKYLNIVLRLLNPQDLNPHKEMWLLLF